MVRLKVWQLGLLVLPIAAIVCFLLISAGIQIHQWRINWIWAVVTLVFVGWRWLLVRWTTPPGIQQIEAAMAEMTEELKAFPAETQVNGSNPVGDRRTQTAETALQQVIEAARQDAPLWEDWGSFWQRCQELVTAIAHIYHPEIKRPLLNIYIPQAYGLIRGTVDDMDQWMTKLAPALNQMSIGQAVEAYEVYQKLEPTMRKAWQAWSWAQWLLNPVAAVANRATQRSSNQATQQLVVNLSVLLKEVALKNLCHQAIALYSGKLPPLVGDPILPAQPKTQTLQDILAQAEPPAAVAQKPINILLAGRTGAGKSSLINTLFLADKAAVDRLPSTAVIQDYHWQAETGESLTLWDTPGYEQTNRADFRQQVLDRAAQADLLLLVTPALDPALQMDADFLKDIRAAKLDCPAIAIVSQVDKLRPIRDWNPPYDWLAGNSAKEVSIREATNYRAQQLADWCDRVLPIVTQDLQTGRSAWGVEALSAGLLDALPIAKQLRLARFLRNLAVRTAAAAQIIDDYAFRMTTAQGMAAFLKSPILQFISLRTTGSSALGDLLSAQLPVEQTPLVIGKLQMARELFSLLSDRDNHPTAPGFDLRLLWAIAADCTAPPDLNAWAFGHTITEYWTQPAPQPWTAQQLRDRFAYYRDSQSA
jgi:uncharacterized protein